MRAPLALATGAVLAMGAVLTPAAAAPEAPAMSGTAVRFLKIVCPADGSWGAIDRNWHRAYGKAKRVDNGTPVPQYLRRSYRSAAAKHRTAAAKLDAGVWPAKVEANLPKVVSYYVTAGNWLASRDTAVVGPQWLPWSSVTEDDGAWGRILKALDVRAKDCRAYD